MSTEQRTCACKSTDARECFEIRYPAPIADGAERDEYFFAPEECECPCHHPEQDDDDYEGIEL